MDSLRCGGLSFLPQPQGVRGSRKDFDEFNKEQALTRYIELWERRHAEFDQLPDVTRRVARGDYDFFSRVDIELDELEQEAQHNGFILDSTWNGRELVYTIEQMPPEEHAAYLAEEQELALENLKWQVEQGTIQP